MDDEEAEGKGGGKGCGEEVEEAGCGFEGDEEVVAEDGAGGEGGDGADVVVVVVKGIVEGCEGGEEGGGGMRSRGGGGSEEGAEGFGGGEARVKVLVTVSTTIQESRGQKG